MEIPIGIITISRSLKEKNNEAIIYLLDYRLSFGICGFDAKLAGNSYRKIWPKTNDDVFAEIRRESDAPSEDGKGNEVKDDVPSEDRKGNEVKDEVPSEDRKGNEASGKEETR